MLSHSKSLWLHHGILWFTKYLVPCTCVLGRAAKTTKCLIPGGSFCEGGDGADLWRELPEVLSHFLAAEYLRVPSSLGLWSRFLLLRPGFIIPITFPLYNHLTLCKHQSRTRELRKWGLWLIGGCFSLFHLCKSLLKNVFIMRSACLLFFRDSSFSVLVVKITLNFSVVFQLTYHSPTTHLSPQSSLMIISCFPTQLFCCCLNPSFR